MKKRIPEESPAVEGRTPSLAASLTRVPLCTVDGCPAPSDESWHHCFLCGKAEVQHHHLPKKGMGGHNPKSKIVAALCQKHHDQTDTVLGNCVKDYPDGTRHYLLWQIQPYKLLVERAIGEAGETTKHPSGNAVVKDVAVLARLSDHPQVTPNAVAFRGSAVLVSPLGEGMGTDSGPPSTLSATGVVGPDVSYEEGRLILRDGLPFERFQEIIASLEYMQRNLNWLIGDAALYGERTYGEESYQAFSGFERMGFGLERIKQCAWVAEKFSPVTRVISLSWSVHRIAAALPEPERAELLERAEREKMTVLEVREAIREPKPECMHSWLVGVRCSKCGKWEEG